MLLLLASPALGQDLLVLRDGSRHLGQLQACVGDQCRLDGQAIERSEIAWLGLGEQGTPPTPSDPARDEIWLRDQGAQPGPLLGISLGVVASGEGSIDRGEVTWIYFGSPAGAPDLSSPSQLDEVPEAAIRPSPWSEAPPLAGTPPAPPAPRSAADRSPATPSPPAGGPPRTTPAAPAAAPLQLYLNEVGVLLERGGTGFVELSNPGPDPISLASVALRNERSAVCRLPQGANVAASGLYLISLDGATADGGAHCPRDFLSAEGYVELQSAGGRWDLLDWGETPFGLALRTRGGRIAAVAPGTSFGRPPLAPGTGQPTWVRYGRAQVTPGVPNPLPAVDSFMALPGAIFDRRSVPLTWYAVGGATRYRVQISTSADFAVLLSDRDIETPGGHETGVAQAITEPLPDGRYFWRVQALSGAGEAPFSATQSFEVDAAGDSAPGAEVPAGNEVGAPASSAGVTEVILPVPWIEQRKDTSLLALEADEETGPRRWDGPWEVQPPYCARAAIAMVNADYGGELSQDRITYEAYHDWLRSGGPEIDLYIRAGLTGPMIEKALRYALGAPARRAFLVPVEDWERELSTTASSGQYFIWQHVVDELEERRPVVGTTESHAVVFAGYRRTDSGPVFRILDPAMGTYYFRPGVFRELTGTAPEPAGTALTEFYFLPKREAATAASDERSIKLDSDRDGVMDFDEEFRFKTKVNDRDSDADGVGDKEEIRASTFEPPHGWSLATRNLRAGERFPAPADTGRDLDRDGKAMELDPDSDDGGCEDGEEDLNADGKRTRDESSNFERGDDPTIATGECAEQWTGTSQTRIWSREPDDLFENEITAELRWREVARIPILDPGPEHGGREAGKRIGTWSDFTCAGTTLHGTWRQIDGTCTTLGSGAATVVDAETRIDGSIVRKHVDWDLTPILGFDPPREGGFYWLSCGRGEPTFPVETSCSDGLTFSQTAGFSQLGIGLGTPGIPPRCHHDPEVRRLTGGGNQMTGSYHVFDPSSECAPQAAAMTWSLCKVGTPCAPLPPLPGAGEKPEPPPR